MKQPLTILVVEDEPNDAHFLKLAFEKAGVNADLHFACDGKQATDYLRGLPPFKNRAKHPLPHLLVLDLKMPRLDGLGVLEWLRKRADANPPFVVVFSGSNCQADLGRARALGADLCVEKPPSFAQLVGVVERLTQSYLLHLAQAPPAQVSESARPIRHLAFRPPSHRPRAIIRPGPQSPN